MLLAALSLACRPGAGGRADGGLGDARARLPAGQPEHRGEPASPVGRRGAEGGVLLPSRSTSASPSAAATRTRRGSAPCTGCTAPLPQTSHGRWPGRPRSRRRARRLRRPGRRLLCAGPARGRLLPAGVGLPQGTNRRLALASAGQGLLKDGWRVTGVSFHVPAPAGPATHADLRRLGHPLRYPAVAPTPVARPDARRHSDPSSRPPPVPLGRIRARRTGELASAGSYVFGTGRQRP